MAFLFYIDTREKKEKKEKKMATLLFSTKVSDIYKEVSDVIKTVDVTNKDVRVKTMKEIMTESFFHGATRFGDNFIA